MGRHRPFRAGKAAPVGPFERRPIPPEQNPGGVVEQMWTDRDHVVLVQSATIGDKQWIHLAVRRKDGEKIRDHWRSLQRVKDLLLGEEAEAVELYPARSRMVDGDNHYHLWCPLGIRFTFGLVPSPKAP